MVPVPQESRGTAPAELAVHTFTWRRLAEGPSGPTSSPTLLCDGKHGWPGRGFTRGTQNTLLWGHLPGLLRVTLRAFGAKAGSWHCSTTTTNFWNSPISTPSFHAHPHPDLLPVICQSRTSPPQKVGSDSSASRKLVPMPWGRLVSLRARSLPGPCCPCHSPCWRVIIHFPTGPWALWKQVVQLIRGSIPGA